MEWVLQVVDEIDDAIGVVRHGSFGFFEAVRSQGLLTLVSWRRRQA